MNWWPLFLLLLLAACTTGVTTPTGQAVVCPADARICPDGSLVGRIGPTCDFAPCAEVPGVICDYSDPWKSYYFRSAAACRGKIIECSGGWSFSDVCGCGCILPQPLPNATVVVD